MLPLPLTAAGALAGAAYLNARWSLTYDALFFRTLGATALRLSRAGRADKINAFYVLEEHSRDKTTAARPFILFEGKAYTYAETYETVLRYAAWLHECCGVWRGDIVALDYENSETFVFLWFAIWAVGAKPAFINYHLQGAALAHCLRVSTAKLAVVDFRVAGSVPDFVRQEVPDMRFVIFTPEVEAEARIQEPVRYPDGMRSENDKINAALLIFTSGTTGMPKPGIVSWARFYLGINMTAMGTGSGPSDVIYTCMPLYHSVGCVLGVGGALILGATIAIGRRYSTKTFWKEVRDTQATVIQYVRETCRYLTVAPPEIDPVTGENLDRKHRVRAAMGNGLRPDNWDRFKERFGIDTIYELYGATEGAMGLWNLSRNSFAKGAIGRFGLFSGLAMGLRTALVLLDDQTELPWRDPKTGFCQRVKTGEVGEFIVRLPAEDIKKGYQGYLGDAAATNSKVLRDVFRKGDAWFRSGDLMRWDSEGRVYFSDRIGDTFRWKSENVSTAEVAQALGLHPAVQEANVYGVQLPNHDGRAGCVAIVLDTNEPGPQLLASLAAHASKELPRYAVPLFLRLRKEVGMQSTGNNKQQKHVLRQQGVDPAKVEGDALFWLRGGTYVPFGEADWRALRCGVVRL